MARGRKRNGADVFDLLLPAAAVLAAAFALKPKKASAATSETGSGPSGSPTSSTSATAAGLDKVVEIAVRENNSHIREVGGNTNRGPRIEQYQAFVGAGGGAPWCMAFVQFCIAEAMGLPKKPKWGNGSCSGVYSNVRKALQAGHLDPKYVVTAKDPERRTKVKPGWVWIKEGHTGLVLAPTGTKEDSYTTIEGNTYVSGKGHGVFEQPRPWTDSKNVAWFDPIAMQEAWLKMSGNA